ncbi:Uncharacterised protein [Vibrio cholerae]|nr:Uncharacterised protein [Vibrio cholerae]
MNTAHHTFKRFCCSKEEGAFQRVHRQFTRQCTSAVLCQFVAHLLRAVGLYFNARCHAFYKVQHRNDHTDIDCHDQIGKHGQTEGEQ